MKIYPFGRATKTLRTRDEHVLLSPLWHRRQSSVEGLGLLKDVGFRFRTALGCRRQCRIEGRVFRVQGSGFGVEGLGSGSPLGYRRKSK